MSNIATATALYLALLRVSEDGAQHARFLSVRPIFCDKKIYIIFNFKFYQNN